MNIALLKTVITVALLLLFSFKNSHGEVLGKTVDIGPVYATFHVLWNDASGIGVNAGYNFPDGLTVQALVHHLRTEDDRFWLCGGFLNFNITLHKRVSPYVLLGYGRLFIEDTDDAHYLPLGFGLKIRIAGRISVRPEIRLILLASTNPKPQELNAGGGLEYRFGIAWTIGRMK